MDQPPARCAPAALRRASADVRVRSFLSSSISIRRTGPALTASTLPPSSQRRAVPPVKLFGVHARYANATYTAASKVGKLAAVETELLGFKEVRMASIILTRVSAAANPSLGPTAGGSPRLASPRLTRTPIHLSR